MGKIFLVDSTLRDGGYINDWKFGEHAIRDICKKISRAGIEGIEVGFVKGNIYSANCTMFPDTRCVAELIMPKNHETTYIGMLDMSAPVSFDKIEKNDGTSFDALRVIFKKDKIDLGYQYCQYVKQQGYKLYVQLVGTDNYSDIEFVEVIKRFNQLQPDVVYIVDSFGLIKRKHFLRLVYLADNNLLTGIALGYHSHNNLQQAFGNAEAMVDCNLKRDIYIDACVFGMGRGAGNLNLELFAEYLNENCNKKYSIEPIIEIADAYLKDIYDIHPWGYSLPFYLSATNGVHPNYAIYYGKKNTLTAKSLRELMRSIPLSDRKSYNKEKAERYYMEYQQNFFDDRESLQLLEELLETKKILLIAPGSSLVTYNDCIRKYINHEMPVVITVNFYSSDYQSDYLFSSNMRRYQYLEKIEKCKKIVTSNIKEAKRFDFMLNYASYISEFPDIIDNAGLMLLRVLLKIGVKSVAIAGMDGYQEKQNYYNNNLDFNFIDLHNRNILIGNDLKKISEKVELNFITPTLYQKQGV